LRARWRLGFVHTQVLTHQRLRSMPMDSRDEDIVQTALELGVNPLLLCLERAPVLCADPGCRVFRVCARLSFRSPDALSRADLFWK
jgi:hypothetical protein